MSEPKQTYGFRLLQVGEVIEREDEAFFSECIPPWHRLSGYGHKVTETSLPMRRRIDPDEGWEIVPWLEKPEPNCEYTRDGISWREYGGIVRSVEEYWILRPDEPSPDEPILAFRRRKQSGWVKCSERLPDAYPVWLLGADNEIAFSRTAYASQGSLPKPHWPLSDGKSFEWDSEVIAWQPAMVPDLPASEKSPAEKAWDEFAATHDHDAELKEAVLWGFEKGAQSK